MSVFKYFMTAAVVACFFATAIEYLYAGSEISVTGGGIIKERVDDETWKITFSLDAFADDSGVYAGYFQMHFHDVDDFYALDKSRFAATEFEYIVLETHDFEGTPYTFVKFLVHGSLDGEEGWSAVLRFADFGTPVRNRLKPDNHADAVRIQLMDPDYQQGDPIYYDTALEYTHDQSRRALLDGGNISVHLQAGFGEDQKD